MVMVLSNVLLACTSEIGCNSWPLRLCRCCLSQPPQGSVAAGLQRQSQALRWRLRPAPPLRRPALSRS